MSKQMIQNIKNQRVSDRQHKPILTPFRKEDISIWQTELKVSQLQLTVIPKG